MTNLDIYQRELKKYPPLKPEVQYQLGMDYQLTKDIKLRDKLINHNLRYAYKVAFSWSNYFSIEDCISIANEGIIGAIEGWKPELGTLPTFLKKHLAFCFKNYNYYQANTIKQRFNQTKKEDYVKPIMVSTGDTVSGKEGLTIGDCLVSDYIEPGEMEDDSDKLKDMIWSEIKYETDTTGKKKNDTRAFDIIKGLYAEKEDRLILDEIGEMYGVTKQCINQKKKDVFKRLRNNKKLQDIFNNEIETLK